GGAGPEAGALLFQNIIRAYQHKGSWQDHDFPQIMLLSKNFSPMIDPQFDTAIVTEELQNSINLLDAADNQIVGIACNTLHTFLHNINFKKMKFINIVDAVTQDIIQNKLVKILFLGTNTSVHHKLYEKNNNLEIIYPEIAQQNLIQDCIIRILKNKHSKEDSLLIKNIIDDCDKKISFDGVVLGCTELSIIHQNFIITSFKNHIIFDPIAILAQALISTE
ncbi:MAG: aspartate/glutamate racemase family protein, partial [Silvanigrellaceae bacterium]|nr:aspartate/glutamate racemase family protein [Silvanigrellaceae bacterium]